MNLNPSDTTTTTTAILAAATVGLAATAAQDRPPVIEVAMDATASSTDRSAAMPEQADGREFATWASDGHRYAIAAAKLVAERSDDPAVVSFAERVRRDHERGMALLEDAAAEAGVALPEGIENDSVRLSLADLRGNAEAGEVAKAFAFETAGNATEARFWYAGQADGAGPMAEYAQAMLPAIRRHAAAGGQVAAGLIDAPSDDPTSVRPDGRDVASLPLDARPGLDATVGIEADGDSRLGSRVPGRVPARTPAPDEPYSDLIGIQFDGDSQLGDRGTGERRGTFAPADRSPFDAAIGIEADGDSRLGDRD